MLFKDFAKTVKYPKGPLRQFVIVAIDKYRDPDNVSVIEVDDRTWLPEPVQKQVLKLIK